MLCGVTKAVSFAVELYDVHDMQISTSANAIEVVTHSYGHTHEDIETGCRQMGHNGLSVVLR